MAIIDPTQPEATAPPTEPEGAAAAPLVPLEPTNPFAPTAGDGEMVAGGGKALRPLLEWLLRRKGRGTGPEVTEESAEDAIAEGLEGVGRRAREEPTLVATPAGPRPGAASVVTGTTRPLPNIDYYSAPETQRVLSMVENHAQRRRAPPEQPHAVTQERAESLDVVRRITGKKPDLGWSPEEMTALRNSLESQASELDAMAREMMAVRRAGGTLSTATLAQFEMASQRLVATNNAVAGLSSDAGRLLNALQIPATDTGMQVRGYAQMVEAAGGESNVLERLALVERAGGDPAAINEAVRDTFQQRLWDVILSVRYNMMLASIRTHAANVTGSTLAGTYENAVINPMAYLYNLGERGVRRATGSGGFTSDDIANPIPALTLGTMKGAQRGLSLFWRMASGQEVPSSSWGGKFITESGMRYRPQDIPGGVAGKAATTPTRMLEAEDAFFRSVFYGQRLEALARAQAAATAGGDSALYRDTLRDLLDTPPEDMHQQALEYARKLTYTNELNLYGKYLEATGGAAMKAQQWGVMKLLIPFVRTPANLLGYTIENSPFAPVMAPNRTLAQLRGNPRERAEAAARLTAAYGLFFSLAPLVADETITGIGSSNYRQVQLMEDGGWRQNSVRVGDTYYEMSRADPLGLSLALTASLHELWNDPNLKREDIAAAGGAVLLQVADMMMDRSYLSSFGEFMDAIGKGAAGGGTVTRLVASTGVSMINPNITRDVREAVDPFRREQAFDAEQGRGLGLQTRFMKSWRNALPEYSRELPIALDWKGEPISNAGHPLWRATVPVRLAKVEEMPATTRALLENHVLPSKPRSQMTLPSRSRFSQSMWRVPLLSLDNGAGHIYSYYQQLVGQVRERAVREVIGHAEYQRAVRQGHFGTTDSIAGRMLEKALRKGKDLATRQFLQELFDGAEVTLYPGSSAEMRIQLPDDVVESEWLDAFDAYQHASPDERSETEAPPGLMFKPPKQGRIPGAAVEF